MTIPTRPDSPEPLVIGSRGSPLALFQARWIQARLDEAGARAEIRIVRTGGDRSQSTLLASGTVGIFVREIEEELLAGRIDLAVHSLKDLPLSQPEGLRIAAVPAREDPADVLILPEGSSLADLPHGAVVGTGSPRRIGQLRFLRPDLRFEPIRGNVDTRVRKLREGGVGALVLAAAGLNRLAIQDVVRWPLPFAMMLPAPGQGALGIEIRASDAALSDFLRGGLEDPAAAAATRAERAFLKALGGGCQMPVGALGVVEGSELFLQGAVAAPDGSRVLRDEERGAAEGAESIGKKLGERMLASGAADLMAPGSREAP
ncbi:MAG TPA: hydroxymethylbilane synthase [Candidatus Polarisedimenticolia bacterium]|jgi:hydroxymethylbilane synthase|nr:hydroxymethylbilane synthase [Candidatus Polarisedimenticolia bacterium]